MSLILFKLKFYDETLGSREMEHFPHAGDLSCRVQYYKKLFRSCELFKDTEISFVVSVPHPSSCASFSLCWKYQLPCKLNGRRQWCLNEGAGEGMKIKPTVVSWWDMIMGMKMCEAEKLPPPGWQMRVQCETFGLDTWTEQKHLAAAVRPCADTEHGVYRCFNCDMYYNVAAYWIIWRDGRLCCTISDIINYAYIHHLQWYLLLYTIQWQAELSFLYSPFTIKFSRQCLKEGWHITYSGFLWTLIRDEVYI